MKNTSPHQSVLIVHLGKWVALVLLLSGLGCKKTTTSPFAASSDSSLRIFPGAKGFGIHSPAGRGGKIIKVTNLNADGPGSLRNALAAKGPRIVVFEAGGVIDLNKVPLVITEPFLTVAGQTAPSPGISLIREGMRIETHDVLIQHIRFRMGDAGMPKKSGFTPECTTSGPQAYNIVVDHCSFSWAVDENMSVSGPRYDGPAGTSRNVTISRCIVAEGLYDASHEKGIHSMGTLVHDNCTNVAVVFNLYAHNNQRNPYFKAFTTGAIVNNVIYNPGKWGIQVDFPEDEWIGKGVTPQNCKVSVVGNWMQHGANTKPGFGIVGPKGDVYLEDNVGLDIGGKAVPQTYGSVRILPAKPSWPDGLKALPSEQVVSYVVKHAGARPQDRDEVDARIVSEFLARQGKFINSQEEVGGYPTTRSTVRSLDVPKDNIDAWLLSFAKPLE